jgi:hypothetical protein
MTKRRLGSLYLFLTIALVPVTILRGPGQSAIVDLLALVGLPLFALTVLARHEKVRVPFLVPVFAITLGSLIATMNALSPQATALALAQDAYLIAWFVFLVHLLRNRRDLTAIRVTWVWVANVVAVIGLAAVLLTGVGLLDLVRPSGPRALGTFPDPNYFADYLVLSFFMVLGLSEETGRLFRWISAALLVTAIIATKSNGGLLSLLVGLVVWAFARAWTRRVPRPALAAAVLLFAGLMVGGAWLVNGYGIGRVQMESLASQSVLGRAGHSSEGRFHIWNVLLRTYAREPLGIGPGNSRALQLHIEERERPDSYMSKEAHNDYLGYLIERGPLALAGLLLLRFQALGKVVTWFRGRMAAGHRSGGAFAAASMGALAASAMHSTTIENLHFRHVWFFLAIVCSLDGMVFRSRATRRMANVVTLSADARVAAAT